MVPSIEQLGAIFRYLDQHAFHTTSRLPLVASRQWSPGLEFQAWRRFRQGLSNFQEVAVPKLYWATLNRHQRNLFLALSLGRGPLTPTEACLQPLLDDQGLLEWSIVARFGRYVLRTSPERSQEDFVYLGDDTLFLMEEARRLLSLLQEQSSQRPLRLLDLCCGGGGVGLALPRFLGQLKGIDLNPRAIRIAHNTARAQGVENYHYECTDMAEGLTGTYDLIFGNPPTLSPSLTGRDVFYATGTEERFYQTLRRVDQALAPDGRAVLTFFSEVRAGLDRSWEVVGKIFRERRAVRCLARREYPLAGQSVLRHSVLELGSSDTRSEEYRSLVSRGVRLPGLTWRRS